MGLRRSTVTGQATTAASSGEVAESAYSEWRRFRRVFFGRKVVIFGALVILLFVVFAIFAPLIAPYGSNEQNLRAVTQQPSSEHLLGTDALGRDTLTRIIYGSRISLLIGVGAVAMGSIVGMLLGLIAGFFGGWLNQVIMRIMDALMAFPMILLALLVAGVLGGGLLNVIIALAVGLVPGSARLVCGQVLSVKENDYILLSRSTGTRSWRIMLSHVIPNCMPPLIVFITMTLGGVVLGEAALSYLGIGITPPTATWGAMVNDGQRYLLTNPLLAFAPGVALMLLVFAFNMVGDGLRDALDPRLRGVL
jgi:peptide/nickel transport system permease protein